MTNKEDIDSLSLEEKRKLLKTYLSGDNRKDFPLSYAQERIWFIEQLNTNQSAYNLPIAFKIEGELNIALLENCINSVIRTHEALRTRFIAIEGRPRQIILPHEHYSVQICEVGENDNLEQILLKEIETKFNFDNDLLFRFKLFRTGYEANTFLAVIHHIICDGWSTNILLHEIATLYNSNCEKTGAIQKYRYVDYALEQTNSNNLPEIIKQLSYWKEKLKGIPLSLQLPADKNPPAVKSYEGDRVNIAFSMADSLAIDEFIKSKGVTSFNFFLSTFSFYLSRVCSQSDFIIGIPVANRHSPNVEKLIGLFVNVLPLPIRVNKNLSFEDLLHQTSGLVIDALDHQHAPYEKIVEILNPERRLDSSQVVQAFFVYHDKEFTQLPLLGLRNCEFVNLPRTSAKLDLEFHLWRDNDHTLKGFFNYNTDIFLQRKIEYVIEQFKFLVTQVIVKPDCPLSTVSIIPPAEVNLLQHNLNNRRRDYDQRKTLVTLFEERVLGAEEDTAIICKGEKITHKSLKKRADQIAYGLKERGIDRGDKVGLLLHRSFDVFAAMLGTLKAGGVCVPIDPKYPDDRIRYILANSDTKLVLVNDALAERLPSNVPFTDVKSLQKSPPLTLATTLHSDDLAFIIYTSGSTGKPKGVMIPHTCVHNLVIAVTPHVTFSGKTILSLCSIAFDMFITESVFSLIAGAKIIMASEEEVREPHRLNQLMVEHNVNILQTTASRIKMLVESEACHDGFSTLDTIISAGEEFPKALHKKLKTYDNIRIFNFYGPTEITVFSTFDEITNKDEITIGRPIENTTAYILNEDNQIQPIGTKGEIAIGGDCVTKGYYNDELLTKTKYIQNPLNPDERIYKTGDIGNWSVNGFLEISGRSDFQVKIGGYRIEPGEIEYHLQNYPGIKEALVIAKEDNKSNRYLCAYYVRKNNAALSTTGALTDYLSGLVPEYMIPSFFFELPGFHFTESGKIDRRELLNRKDELIAETKFEAPNTDLEVQIANCWKEVLQTNRLGINDNFFYLGGKSFYATIVSYKINKRLNLAISVIDIFKYPTVKKLVSYINSIQLKSSALKKAERKLNYKATISQQRLYAIQAFNPQSIEYNIPKVFVINGLIDKRRLEGAFKKTIERHCALRTSFQMQGGHCVQIIHDTVDFALHLAYDQSEDITKIVNAATKPFNLEKVPLIRATLVEAGREKFILIIDIHHIVCDGRSLDIFYNDLEKFYNGNHDENDIFQLVDYTEWYHEKLQNLNNNAKAFWAGLLIENLEASAFPFDFQKNKQRNYEGVIHHFHVDVALTELIKKVARNNEASVFVLLFAAYHVLLSKYAQLEKVFTGTIASDRNNENFENVVGMFVSTLPMVSAPSPWKTFSEFLKEFKALYLNILQNQYYDIEQWSRNHGNPGQLEYSTVFMQQTDADPSLIFENIITVKQDVDFNVAKFDLAFLVSESGEKIDGQIIYSPHLYSNETIRSIASRFIELLRSIIANQNVPLHRLAIMTDEDKLHLEALNKTEANYRLRYISELFEEIVNDSPNQVALLYRGSSITYSELNSCANRLAHFLRSKGAKPGEFVGVMGDRSINLVIGILAILKSGAAYVPIDTNMPKERVTHVLLDCKPICLLIDSEDKRELLTHQNEVYDIPGIIEQTAFNASNLGRFNRPTDVAYTIYTSGTTGKPKGVMIPHEGIHNTLQWRLDAYGMNTSTQALQLFSHTFDGFLTSLFTPLLSGGTIHLLDEVNVKDVFYIHKYIKDFSITHFIIVPTLYNALLQVANPGDLDSVKIISVGGEKITKGVVSRSKEINKDVVLVNEYGPTECSVVATWYYDITAESVSLIGKPLPNIKVFIVDNNNKILPVGIPGEICLAGPGVAKGYLNNEELTRNKFIQLEEYNDIRVYKTGDIGRWLGNGNIEFYERNDFQVKIRGFRIETGEIEYEIKKYPNVLDAAVVSKEGINQEKQLVAYIVSGDRIPIANLREALRKTLPYFMIPSFFYQLDKIPLTANGKIDRAALPVVDESATFGLDYLVPGNEVEEIVINATKEVLGRESVGMNDNFFDMGGNSISGVCLIHQLNGKFNLKMTTVSLFENPNLKSLSDHIAQQLNNTMREIEKGSKQSNNFDSLDEALTLFN